MARTSAPSRSSCCAGRASRGRGAEGHLCCGSAGTYNILQPEIATRLRDRKVANIMATVPQAVATGNIGCISQISTGTDIPVVHTVELLDWAYGGPIPEKLKPICGNH